MEIPRLLIQTTPGRIQIQTKSGQLTLEQPQGNLSIEQPKADVNITTIPGKLTIDQTKAREDVDLKSIRKRKEEAALLGKQSVLAGINRRVQEGEQLMKIENGFQAIASTAKKTSESKVKEFGLGFIPKAGSVQISYERGKVQIDISPNKPVINYTPQKPIIEYQPGEVLVEMEQYPLIKIDVDHKNSKE